QYEITGAGAHTLRWRYVKDGSVSEGDDCGWVDYLQWTGETEPPDPPAGDTWETVTYVYDPAGRRIAKAFDGQVAVRYLYDGDHCIAEYDSNDVLLRKFVYGPGVDQPICMTDVEDANAVYYYHFDGLGSVVALSDATGDTVQVYEYSIYGQPAAADPNHPNPYLFSARRFDSETGLYHYRARAYNPYIGRFLQTDPAGQGMNAYAYCANNSTNRVDPTGMIYYEILDRPLDKTDPAYNKVTLGEFNDDGTPTGRTRSFSSLEKLLEHMKVRYDLWVDLPECAGWMLSTAHAEKLTEDEEFVFWSIQTLILLDHSFKAEVEEIERDPSASISLLSGIGSDSIVSGTQVSWAYEASDYIHLPLFHREADPHFTERANLGWYRVPPLAMLAHELAHASSVIADKIEDEKNSVAWENVFRYAFYKKVPGYGWVLPRPAYGWSDLGEPYEPTLSGLHPDISWDEYWKGHNGGVYPLP
ncbi:MAG: RHS repeat-associated core domain-containing protein, partial [Sedimentisphaerales bacterium]|nr:RHS repeat-associated core domain-containing protein [Sedimentisphaerales bacterium]